MSALAAIGVVFVSVLYLCLSFLAVWKLDHWIEQRTGSLALSLCVAVPTLAALLTIPFAIASEVM